MHTSTRALRSLLRPTLVISLIALAQSATSVALAQPSGAAAARKEFLQAAKLTPNPENGRKLYETCAACHGPRGLGTSDGSIPAIAGQHGSFLLKQLTDFRHDRRWDERMEHFTDRHHLETPQDVTDVAAYVSRLPRFPAMTDYVGDGAFLREGASVYFQRCEACHGPLGEGDMLRLRPRLAGQHYEYLLRQIVSTIQGYRPAMDPAHVERLRQLTPEQIRGVADYLSRVSPGLSADSQRQTRLTPGDPP